MMNEIRCLEGFRRLITLERINRRLRKINESRIQFGQSTSEQKEQKETFLNSQIDYEVHSPNINVHKGKNSSNEKIVFSEG
jgi:hypothetical protein